MSIHDVIKWRIAEGRLHRLPMLVTWNPLVRAMLVTPAILSLLQGPWSDEINEARAGVLHADLEAFIAGNSVTHQHLKRLSPARDQCWEIRSVRDDPSIRVLGGFIERDVFVAINYAKREDLGGWKDRRWRDFKETCKTEWSNLFHPYLRAQSITIHDVVTGAIDGKYFY